MWKDAPCQKAAGSSCPGHVIDPNYRHRASPDIRAFEVKNLTSLQCQQLVKFWNDNYAIDRSYGHCYDAAALKCMLGQRSTLFCCYDAAGGLKGTILGEPAVWQFEEVTLEVVLVDFLCSTERGLATRLIHALGSHFEPRHKVFLFMREKASLRNVPLTCWSYLYCPAAAGQQAQLQEAPPWAVWKLLQRDEHTYGRLWKSFADFQDWVTRPHRRVVTWGYSWLAVLEDAFIRTDSGKRIYEIVWAFGSVDLDHVGLEQAHGFIWKDSLDVRSNRCEPSGSGKVYVYNAHFNAQPARAVRWL